MQWLPLSAGWLSACSRHVLVFCAYCVRPACPWLASLLLAPHSLSSGSQCGTHHRVGFVETKFILILILLNHQAVIQIGKGSHARLPYGRPSNLEQNWKAPGYRRLRPAPEKCSRRKPLFFFVECDGYRPLPNSVIGCFNQFFNQFFKQPIFLRDDGDH
jgi:hypothetical protein